MVHVYLFSTRVTKSFAFWRNFAIILIIETHALKMGHKINLLKKINSAGLVNFIQAVCFEMNQTVSTLEKNVFFKNYFFLNCKGI